MMGTILNMLDLIIISKITAPLAKQQPDQTADHMSYPSNTSKSYENRAMIFPIGVTS